MFFYVFIYFLIFLCFYLFSYICNKMWKQELPRLCSAQNPQICTLLISSFAYFSPPSLVFLCSLFYISSLPPSYFSLFSLSNFSIPEQMDHTCNFLDFYFRFQMVSWQRQIGYRIYISLIPKIQRLKIQNMRGIIVYLLCAKISLRDSLIFK